MTHRYLPLPNQDLATAAMASYRTLSGQVIAQAVGRIAKHARVMSRMTSALAVIIAIFCIAQSASAEGLKMRIFNATAAEWNTTSVLIMGDTEMIVVCGQSMKSSAERLAEEIRATGLRLKAVFLTHAHLDHSQGASVILKHFPEAKFIATPDVAARQRARIPTDDAFARQVLGSNAAVPSVPAEDYEGTTLEIDGEIVELWTGLYGDAANAPPDEPHTALYIPSLHTLIPSDIVYNNAHVSMGNTTPESRAKWVAQLEGWMERDFALVVPGHQPAGSELTSMGALTHTRDYVIAYGEEVERASTGEELIAAMLRRFPDIKHEVALRLSARIDFRGAQ